MGFKVGDKVKHKSLHDKVVTGKIQDTFVDGGDAEWYLLEDGLYYRDFDLERVED